MPSARAAVLHRAMRVPADNALLADPPELADPSDNSAPEEPEGFDMLGMECTDPIAFDDGWWSCGMRS